LTSKDKKLSQFKPTHLQAHFIFIFAQSKRTKKQKELASQRTMTALNMDIQPFDRRESTTGNSTYPKGEVSCSADTFVVTRNLVFQIKFCGKSPALRVAANLH